jgi:hypothetical protein
MTADKMRSSASRMRLALEELREVKMTDRQA